ncbi:hypothetical protein [Amnibacterium kyonggiense]|uniref:Uncharacterized protein n=1 Tax=Amnibacterium kyonggiense TaxID=595671 RepID=A0A4R7FKD0_9MICO|nr:hypothetical protein [Amnibacterium kyonggiense]TDS76810.1 hypothetical protein CLV52_1746 [Amnibacterium kyonggiense]
MHLSALRTAAIAGSCAIALSFVALPAHAVTVSAFSHSGSESGTSSSDSATTSTDDSGTAAGDDGTATEAGDGNGGAEAGDDNGSDATDDGTDAGDDQGDDASDDQGGDTGGSASTPVALPAEQGTPTQTFRDTVLLPKELRTRGIKVVYSGLTRKAHYQPYFSGGQSGGPISEVKRANGNGSLTLVIRPRKDLAWMSTLGASFVIGLRGVDTDLDLTQQIQVKYDSDAALTTERHGKRVALAVSVDRETESGRAAAWKKVQVHFQKKVDGTWVTVKTTRTDAKGVAKATVKAGKAEWRAVVAAGKKVAGKTTRSHRR